MHRILFALLIIALQGQLQASQAAVQLNQKSQIPLVLEGKYHRLIQALNAATTLSAALTNQATDLCQRLNDAGASEKATEIQNILTTKYSVRASITLQTDGKDEEEVITSTTSSTVSASSASSKRKHESESEDEPNKHQKQYNSSLDNQIMYAARTGNLAEVQNLILNKNANPNAVDKNKETPLFHAIKEHHSEVVEFLLGMEAVTDNINAQSSETIDFPRRDGETRTFSYTNTPLILAFKVWTGHKNSGISDSDVGEKNYKRNQNWMKGSNIIQMLLQVKGIDVNIPNLTGETVLMLAIDKHVTTRCIQQLINLGADVNAKDTRNMTVLTCAWNNQISYVNFFDVITLLFARGAFATERYQEPQELQGSGGVLFPSQVLKAMKGYQAGVAAHIQDNTSIDSDCRGIITDYLFASLPHNDDISSSSDTDSDSSSDSSDSSSDDDEN